MVLVVSTEGSTMGLCRDAGTESKQQAKRLGGHRAVLFIYATEGLENMAFIANAISLVTYFSGYMNFSLTKSANTMTNFLGTAFLLALFGGFISDTYLSRFKSTVLFACIELLGYGLLTAQAHFGQFRPQPCKGITDMSTCQAATSGQVAILYAGLYLVALGTGGVKAALPSLGADQFDEKDPKEAAQLSSFFNWFLLSLTVGGIIGVTFLVWISTNAGWVWNFGICTMAVFFAIVFLCMGKSFYRHNVSRGSPLQRILQVFVAAIRNRKLPLPQNGNELHEIRDREDGEILSRTGQFRFLDRSAIVPSTTTGDASTSITSSGPWQLCTVTQVEETKILLRMLPIILSTVFMNTCLAQLQTFSIQQSTTLNNRIGGFKVPGPSIPVIPLLFVFILIPIYDRIFVPVARKITGIPTGIRRLQRVGVGLVLSTISMAVSGLVETRRKSVAIRHNMVDSSEALPMSLFWLGYQYAIFGAADMFTLVGLLEFFYAESSAGMKSLGTAISWSSVAFGYFTSTAVVETVNKVSGGWLGSNNLNRDKLDYFYYLLAAMSFVNFGFYLTIASWYKYKKVLQLQENQNEIKDGVEIEMLKV